MPPGSIIQSQFQEYPAVQRANTWQLIQDVYGWYQDSKSADLTLTLLLLPNPLHQPTSKVRHLQEVRPSGFIGPLETLETGIVMAEEDTVDI